MTASTTYRSATRPPRGAPRADSPATTHEHGEPFTTADGRALLLRSIRPDDAEALRRGFARLTPEQARLRTFHRQNELPLAVAERMATVDPATTAAWVAVDADGDIRGEARLHVDPTTDSAEFGVAIDPAFTSQGIGRRLMQRLIDDAERRGLDTIWGDVLVENHTMLDFVKSLGAEREFLRDEPGITRVRLRVRAPPNKGELTRT